MIMSSKAVKIAMQSAGKNKLSVRHFVSDFSIRHASTTEDKYIQYEKERMLKSVAENIRENMPMLATPAFENGENGINISGECYVFTKEQLLQLLDQVEAEVQKGTRVNVIWGD